MSALVGEPLSIRTLAVKSVAWYGGTRLWSQGVSWVATIFLARLLSPQDYGLFAMALSALAFVELFQEFGLNTAIVQREDLTRGQIDSIFWTVSAACLALTGVIWAAADLVSGIYGEPRISWLLRFLSLTLFMNALGLVPHSLLTRSIDLRRRSLAEGLSVSAGAVVAIFLALRGYGVWALVYGQLAKAVVGNTALAVLARWLPHLDLDLRSIQELVRFGLRVVGSTVIGTLSTAANTLIIGRLLGSTAVGLYSMGQALADAPNRVSTAVINQVSLPVFSRLQRDRPTLVEFFLKISKYLAIVAVPVQIGLALIAADLVPLLLSEKWEDVVILLQMFCVGGVIVVTTLTASPLLTAVGRPDVLLRFSSVAGVLIVTASAIGTVHGVRGVAAAWLIALVPLRFCLLRLALRELRLPMMAYCRALVTPLIATGIMLMLVLTAQRVLSQNAPRIANVIVSIAIGAVAYGVSLFLIDRGLGAEARGIARALLAR